MSVNRKQTGFGWVRVTVYLLVVFGLLLAGAFSYLLTAYEEAPVDLAWELAGSGEVPEGAVTVRFTGTSTLLFSDGETHWLVDGWFSRPGPLSLLFGKIGPDLNAIEAGLAANGIEELAAVFPVHSHYDHAMDAPEVARRTGALLLGSEATANIGRGWGLPEAQIQVVADRQPVQLGNFTITPIVSRHFQFPDARMREDALSQPDIDKPLVPPVPTFEYRLGKAYVLQVSHPLGSWLVVGSAGFVEGALEGLSVDLVFLGVGGLGSQTPEYRATYWQETIGRVNPSRVIPIHYDSLTAPIEGPFRGQVKAAGLFMNSSEDSTLRYLQHKALTHPQLNFQTLPRYKEVVLFP